MSEHLKGPWVIEIGEDGRPSGVCQEATGWNVCTFPATAWKGAKNRQGAREKILANAKLIADAPETYEQRNELLEALRSVLAVSDRKTKQYEAAHKAIAHCYEYDEANAIDRSEELKK